MGETGEEIDGLHAEMTKGLVRNGHRLGKNKRDYRGMVNGLIKKGKRLGKMWVWRGMGKGLVKNGGDWGRIEGAEGMGLIKSGT